MMDGVNEIKIEEAGRRHKIGLLTGDEIRSIRESLRLSREKFGYLTGFGEKSIKRWETQQVMQNIACDRFLRIIRDDPQVITRLYKLANERGKK
jgi:DNA-binding transcriptional regulator YiaG